MIYLIKKNDRVEAIGDMETLIKYLPTEARSRANSRQELEKIAVETADMVITPEEWDNAQYLARIEDGQIVLGPDKNILFSWLRSSRILKFGPYDDAMKQLTRELRLADTVEKKAVISRQIAEWDAYAKALCDLPEQDGAPWDGGRENTPWPKMPEIKG